MMSGPNPSVVIQGPAVAPTMTGSAFEVPTSGPLPGYALALGKRPFVFILAPHPGRQFGRGSDAIDIYLSSETE
jgi:hypothetical protein